MHVDDAGDSLGQAGEELCVGSAAHLSLQANLAALDVKNQVVHGLPLAWPALGAAVAGTGVYVALVLTAASAIFARRDFK